MFKLIKTYLLPQHNPSPSNPSTNLITNYIVNPYICNPSSEHINLFIRFLIYLGY